MFVSSNLLPPDSDSDGRDGEEQSTGMQSKKVPSSPEISFLNHLHCGCSFVVKNYFVSLVKRLTCGDAKGSKKRERTEISSEKGWITICLMSFSLRK